MKILLIIAAIVFFNFQLPKVFAAVSCQPIYGGGQTCVTIGSAVVNKKILNPSTNVFVDNLGINDPRYSPGFIVNFRLEVTNTGNATINKVDVKDIFPQYIDFNSGPGNFDPITKTLTFSLDNLAPNETRIFIVIGRVITSTQLPTSGIVCVVNQVIATASEGAISQDNSQFCIERKIATTTKGGFPILSPVPVTTTPSTGPESLALFAMIPTGIAGWFLRKKSEYVNRKEKN